MNKPDKAPPVTINAGKMQNQNYYVLVDTYMYGQWRIKLVKVAGDEIVRELCTYKTVTAAVASYALKDSKDPEAEAESWAKPWNCEGKKGRIRLDTTEADNPYRGREQSERNS